MQRKVAYLFSYKNGIRERSVGILRRYGTADQPEVALELYGEEARKKKWRIYYFAKGEALAEATCLWGITTGRGRSEARLSQCRLCAEAGTGGGILLLPEAVAVGRTDRIDWPDTKEFLCARYDGNEVTEAELREAFRRKPIPETEENLCIQSAKKLMEEITKAANGENVSEEQAGEAQPDRKREVPMLLRKKVERNRIACLEELLFTKSPYIPCRRNGVEYSVRISPDDLLLLPKEGRVYAENSYLLHGYYRYRHVLLGRCTRKEREDYVILVPGKYDEKEAKLAELFGFPEFMPVRSVARERSSVEGKTDFPETGDAASGKEMFGYFCGKI